jgi:hypothetical protein
MASIPEYVRTHPPTGQELANLQAGKRQAEMLAHRVGTAGNSEDVHVMTGNAKGGAGVASGGLGSIPFPLLEPGPSAAQRKRDEAIDADNRARFLRLEARAAAMRNSARADSLRRDSLARKSAVPKPASAPRDTSVVRLRPFRRT